jgi:hypothetical protein
MMHLKRIAAVVVAAGLLLAVAATPARAIPIGGDYSLIDITSAPYLRAAGLDLAALGTGELHTFAILGVTTLVLPVTGGDVALPFSFDGTIEHSGSGLRLSSSGINLDLTNFVMNTITSKMSANYAIGAATGAGEIFDILACGSGPPGTCFTLPRGAVIPSALRLSFTDLGAGLVNFVIPGLAGAGMQFGVANTALTAVPEPGTALLVGSALVGLAALRRNRRA